MKTTENLLSRYHLSSIKKVLHSFRSSDSPGLKPVRVEVNKLDEDSSRSSDLPAEASLIQSNNTLNCLGCDKQFDKIASFNRHASFTHSNDVDSMFFKSLKGTFFSK